MLTNEAAIKVFDFFLECKLPEEHFYSTLYMVPGVPGGFNPNIPAGDSFKIINAFWDIGAVSNECSGRVVHHICIVTSGDLKEVIERSGDGSKALFHNKYFMEDDHTVMDCMEERLLTKNKREFEAD